ncbi:AMP phosphorylase [Candidatus Woesearchaeota archaeon]|nr:AMP phosphorylase [Candidatus Woesearchaeota archaeon]
MKFIVKDMDVATGGTLVAVMNENDALMLDLHLADRIRLKKGRRETIVVVDFAQSEKAVPQGSLGLFEEVLEKLNAEDGDSVKIRIERKPDSLRFIKKKLDGKELKYNEVKKIIDDTVSNAITTIELTYYVAANYMRGMSMKETVALTRSMIDAGDKLDFGREYVVDKHCIGGVPGNRTTMVIVPILAAAGLTIPKTSSRSITSPAGTADTMEVLSEVSLPINDIYRVVRKAGGCMVWGGAVDLAPADDTIINVEHPLSIDAEGQLLASIMAKKGSVSATHVIIDIPVGRDAKIESVKEAKHLKMQFERVAREIGMIVKVIITDGSQPIGKGIGPALEARDVLWLLKGDKRTPDDLRQKSLRMAGLVLEMTGNAKKGKGRQKARDILDSGEAYQKFIEIIRLQGARVTDERKIILGKHKLRVKAKKNGTVKHISNKSMARIARLAGCPKDKGAGIMLWKKKGDKVKKGEKIFTVFAENRHKMGYVREFLDEIDGFVVG